MYGIFLIIGAIDRFDDDIKDVRLILIVLKGQPKTVGDVIPIALRGVLLAGAKPDRGVVFLVAWIIIIEVCLLFVLLQACRQLKDDGKREAFAPFAFGEGDVVLANGVVEPDAGGGRDERIERLRCL